MGGIFVWRKAAQNLIEHKLNDGERRSEHCRRAERQASSQWATIRFRQVQTEWLRHFNSTDNDETKQWWLNINGKTANQGRMSRYDNKQEWMKAYDEGKREYRKLHYMSGVTSLSGESSSTAGVDIDKPLWCFDFFLLSGDVKTRSKKISVSMI